MIGGTRIRQAALVGALGVALAACGGSSATASPAAAGGGTAAPAASATPAGGAGGAATPAASQASSGGGDALSALSGLNSYKVKLAIGGTGVTGGVASMGNIEMSGIVVLKPERASDITMTLGGTSPGASADPSADASATALGIRIVEVNGKSYTDIGTGTLTENTDGSQTSLVDSLSPDKLLGQTSTYLKDMKSVGDEQKNGVQATHYQADDSVLKEAAAGLAMLGIKDATWKWDVWIAKDGGYVVSYLLVGSGSDNSQLTMSLDITDVNSPSNVVKGP